jgi:hypothetical protein
MFMDKAHREKKRREILFMGEAINIVTTLSKVRKPENVFPLLLKTSLLRPTNAFRAGKRAEIKRVVDEWVCGLLLLIPLSLSRHKWATLNRFMLSHCISVFFPLHLSKIYFVFIAVSFF